MDITRREALKQWLIIVVGATIIPSCKDDETDPAIVLNNLKLTAKEQQLLAEISEAIIPATDSPGAKDTLAHLFVLRMVDDTYSKEEQQQFVTGMKEFEELAKKNYSNSFADMDAARKEEFLNSILNNKNKDIPENTVAFIKTMKKLTVQGYTSSKHFLTKIKVYELVPGRFHGCFPINSKMNT